MKIPYFILLIGCVSISNSYAVGLPPVLNVPTTKAAEPVKAPVVKTAVKAPVKISVSKLRSDIKTLKSIVKKQDAAIKSLNKQLAVKKAPVLVKKQTAATTHAELKTYNNAMSLFKRKNYSKAAVGFQQMLTHYPAGRYAGNAQFWLAEILMQKGNKQGALLAFDKVLRNYPKSGKVPDSLFKLGSMQLSLNKKDKAAEYFNYVIRYYPNSAAAKFAKVKKASAGLP